MQRQERRSIYARVLSLMGCIILFPCLLTVFYPQEWRETRFFLAPGIASCAAGFLLGRLSGKPEGPGSNRLLRSGGSRVVLEVWLMGFFLGALPFYLTGKYSAVQSLFESVSGFTTTGLSVVDVTEISHLFLFYRSFIQFIGGMGFILMMLLFVQEKRSMDLYNAEGHPDRLEPNIGKTARTIFAMYSGLLLAGVLSYTVFGMNLFESMNHAMCALSTGGFSTRAESIAEYESLGVEAVTVFLMLAGTTNFGVLLLLVKGRFRQAARVGEVRFMAGLLSVFIPLAATALFGRFYAGPGESLRQAFFNTVSALSTTGFATSSYARWPAAANGVMILLMLIGGGIGSTAGGMKMQRVYLSLRGLTGYLKSKVSSERQIESFYYYKAQGRTRLDSRTLEETLCFIGMYLFIFLAGTFAICFSEESTLTEAMFEFASALGTVGLSIGITGPNTGASTLLIEIAGMVLGRLEIIAVVAGGGAWLAALRKSLDFRNRRHCRHS